MSQESPLNVHYRLRQMSQESPLNVHSRHFSLPLDLCLSEIEQRSTSMHNQIIKKQQPRTQLSLYTAHSLKGIVM